MVKLLTLPGLIATAVNCNSVRHWLSLLALILWSIPWSNLGYSAESFRSIYDLAIQQDTDFRAAQATYREGSEHKNIALAPLLPQLVANYEYRDTERDDKSLRTFSFGDTSFVSNSKDSFTSERNIWSVSIDQKLFDLPAWYEWRHGQIRSQIALEQLRSDTQQIIMRVAEAYFGVLSRQNDLENIKAESASVEDQLERASERFRMGLVPVADVHEAQAAHDEIIARRLGVENDLFSAKQALQVITNESPGVLYDLSDKFTAHKLKPANPDEWVALALEKRPTLRIAYMEMQGALWQVRRSKARHLPTANLSFVHSDVDEDGNSLDNPLESSSKGETLSINLRFPLFSGGDTTARHRQLQQAYLRSKENYTGNKRRVTHQVRSLYNTVETDVARIQARRQSLLSATSALDSVVAGYDAGTRPLLDVLTTQRDLFRSWSAYADARYNYILNLLRLELACGILSSERVEYIDRNLRPFRPPVFQYKRS